MNVVILFLLRSISLNGILTGDQFPVPVKWAPYKPRDTGVLAARTPKAPKGGEGKGYPSLLNHTPGQCRAND